MQQASRWVALVAAATITGSCSASLPALPHSMIPVPEPADVESVIFFIGDAGYADYARSPLVRRLSEDIEYWSGAVARDSAVTIVFLGDNIYPAGLRMEREYFERDSTILQSQVLLVAGQNAREYHTTGWFVAGNHDWGNARNSTGVHRLSNQEQFLDRRRAEGLHVALVPHAGEPGPTVVDVGGQARILLIDTAWWLLAQDSAKKLEMLNTTDEVVRNTKDRFIIFAAHHPFQSASVHAGFVPFWKTLGLRFLLSRSGSIMQDLNSLVYRELTRSLLNSFRAGPPLIFAGGHDHALQVIANDSFPMPSYSIVSGSGSKLSSVGTTDGMLYRASAPGYMRVLIHHTGEVDLFVINAPDETYFNCAGEGEALDRCMVEKTRGFETRFGLRLR